MAITQFWGTGRRKTAVARVRLVPGKGAIVINKRDMDDYFGLETLKMTVRQPLVLTETLGKYDVLVNVKGAALPVRQAPSVMAFPERCSKQTPICVLRLRALAS